MKRALALAVVLAPLTFVQAEAGDEPGCLKWSDLNIMTRTGDDTISVKTIRGDLFDIKFTSTCDYQRKDDHYLTVDVHNRLACIRPGDTFRVHRSGICVVRDVSRAGQPAPQ